MRRFSPTDWFFAIVLAFVLVLGIFAYFAPDRAFWQPIMEGAAYLVAASILVNVYRLWRATAELRRNQR